MPEDSKLLPVNIEDEMRKSYLDYAMSVIVGRALPDVRDGLKPVHRRVLYAMHHTGNTADKPYRKSARTVGTVIGRYHPHGDSAVYDTIVRMAQDFSLRCPLIDGQGNFGSVDGDPPAAMRYTEARLEKLATDLLRDIDKDTVDFIDNYDGSEQEPVVLPAAYPNLLVNGSSGIAVGMTTNVPPHNLREVIDGCKMLIANPDITIEELMEIIPGPDFPTAGQIFGLGGIKQAYLTGRGRLKMRGRAEFEPHPKKKDRSRIVIYEIPYQVNKSHLIEEIANLVRDKRVEGISDIRDESDRDGIRVVVELKRDAFATVVLNTLYKYTKLQSTFGVINLALVNGRPQQLTLKEMLHHFVQYRRETIVRRTVFELRKAEERAHILEGLKIAIDNLDEVVSIIRKSATPPEAKEALCLRFEFSDRQAQAILDMRLQRLTGLERQKIVDEYDTIMKTIAGLKEILGSQKLQFEIVINEMDAIRDKFGDDRRTTLAHDTDEITLEDLIEEEEMVITVSHTGYIKRTALSTYEAQKRGGKGRIGMKTKDEDAVQHLFVASTHDFILVFTSAGKVHWLKVYKIPEVQSAGKGKAVVNLIQLTPGATVRAMLSVREFTDGQFVVLSTRRGYIKKTPLTAFSRPRADGIIALHIEDDDDLLQARLSDGKSEIFMATAQGKSIRFHEKDVRPMGRNARGVIGIRLAADDRLIGMSVLGDAPDILTVTANGYGKRSPISDYRLQTRGGSGIINIRTSERNGQVIDSFYVGDEHELLIITRSGKLIRMSAKGINTMGRATQGVRLIAMSDDEDYVADAIRIAETEKEDEEGADTAADADAAAGDGAKTADGADAADAADTDTGADSDETTDD